MKTIEQMAVDAGFDCVYGGRGRPPGVGKVYQGHFDNEEIDMTGELKSFAALVAEECAKIATVEEALKLTHGRGNPATVGAAAIRAVFCGVDSHLLELPK